MPATYRRTSANGKCRRVPLAAVMLIAEVEIKSVMLTVFVPRQSVPTMPCAKVGISFAKQDIAKPVTATLGLHCRCVQTWKRWAMVTDQSVSSWMDPASVNMSIVPSVTRTLVVVPTNFASTGSVIPYNAVPMKSVLLTRSATTDDAASATVDPLDPRSFAMTWCTKEMSLEIVFADKQGSVSMNTQRAVTAAVVMTATSLTKVCVWGDSAKVPSV